MTDLEIIADMDNKLEIVQDAWAKECAELIQKYKNNPDSSKYQKEVAAIQDKYKGLMADIIIVREEAYRREAARQEEEYLNGFDGKMQQKPHAQLAPEDKVTIVQINERLHPSKNKLD